jgi:hypothetical protein
MSTLKERIKVLEEAAGLGESEVAALQLVFGLKHKPPQIIQAASGRGLERGHPPHPLCPGRIAPAISNPHR